MTWFILALGSALINSAYNAFSKYIVSFRFFSKPVIIFFASLTASVFTLFISYLIGFPELKNGFWLAVSVVALINFVAMFLMFRAYEIGEFSSIYSMLLLTPVFLLFTSFLFLGEIPTILGIFGVLMTIGGLYIVSRNNKDLNGNPFVFNKGNLLAILVAFLWSISTNFDKIASGLSDHFLSRELN